MAYLRVLVVLVLAMLAVVSSMPFGFGGGKHEHYIIHVPYHVHTIHKYHKVPVYIHKEIHHDHHYDHHDHHDHHGWDWD